MTQRLTLSPQNPDPELIRQAAAVIQRRGLVAFPTETVYGLGANALAADAVEKIFRAKGRPANDPLIVHLASLADVKRVAADISPVVEKLAAAFCPGPLTFVLPKQPFVPLTVTAGLETVAVRIPSHPIALALIRASGVPIAAPSANRFGHTSPTTAQHVWDDLHGRVDLILDGGATSIGVESTVLDVSRETPTILRPGGISREDIERVIGEVALRDNRPSAENESQISPGLLGKHYTPKAELFFCVGEKAQALEKLRELAHQARTQGRRVGLLLAQDDLPSFEDCVPYALGASDDLQSIARNLYAGMRALDDQGADIILARDFGKRGLGLALYDRLLRAASQVIEV
ncbi:MAG: threonylcarbamoyl-AMP synthase [Anaerolineales bacterium]|nr:threonylcarbamoyl-AMP synthase [Anaerolineales bacterium]